MDCIVDGVAKSQTGLSNFYFTAPETTLLLFLSLILTILSTWNQIVICLVVIGLFHLA